MTYCVSRVVLFFCSGVCFVVDILVTCVLMACMLVCGLRHLPLRFNN
jgi:hypothetical protein